MDANISCYNVPKNSPITYNAAPKRRPSKVSTRTSLSDCVIHRPACMDSGNVSQTLSQWSTGIQNYMKHGQLPVMYGREQKFTKASMLQNCITNMECSKLMQSTGNVVTRQNYQFSLQNQKFEKMPDESTVTSNRLPAFSASPKDFYDHSLGIQTSSCMPDLDFKKAIPSNFPYGNLTRKEKLLQKEYSNTHSISSRTMQDIDYTSNMTPKAHTYKTKVNSQVFNNRHPYLKSPEDRPSELLFFGDISCFNSQKEKVNEPPEKSDMITVNNQNSPEISKYHPKTTGLTRDVNYLSNRQCNNMHTISNFSNRENDSQITQRETLQNLICETPRKTTTLNDQKNEEFQQQLTYNDSKNLPKRPLIAVFNFSPKEIDQPKTVNDSTIVTHISCENESVGINDRSITDNASSVRSEGINCQELSGTQHTTAVFENSKLLHDHQMKKTNPNVRQKSDSMVNQTLQNDNGFTSCSQSHKIKTFSNMQKSYAFMNLPEHKRPLTPPVVVTFQNPLHDQRDSCVERGSCFQKIFDDDQQLIGTKKTPIIQKPVGPPKSIVVKKSATIKKPIPEKKTTLCQKCGYLDGSAVERPVGNFSSLFHKPSEIQELTQQHPIRTQKETGDKPTCLQQAGSCQSITPRSKIENQHHPVLSNPKYFPQEISSSNGTEPIKSNEVAYSVTERTSNHKPPDIELQTANHLAPPIKNLTGFLKPSGLQCLGTLKEIMPNVDSESSACQHQNKQPLQVKSLREGELNGEAEAQTHPTHFSGHQTESKYIPRQKSSSNIIDHSLVHHSLKDKNMQSAELETHTNIVFQNKNCHENVSLENLNSTNGCETGIRRAEIIKTTENELESAEVVSKPVEPGKRKQSINILKTEIQDKEEHCKSDHSGTCITKKTFTCEHCKKLFNEYNSVETNLITEKGKYDTQDHENLEQICHLTKSSDSYSVETHYLEIQIPIPRASNINKAVESKRANKTQIIRKEDEKDEATTPSKNSEIFPLKEYSVYRQEKIYEQHTGEECSNEKVVKSICDNASAKPPVVIYHKYVPATFNKLSGGLRVANPLQSVQEVRRALTVSFKESYSSDDQNRTFRQEIGKRCPKNKISLKNLMSDPTVPYGIKASEHSVINCHFLNSISYENDQCPPEIQVLHKATKSSSCALNDNSDYGSNDMITLNMSEINISYNNQNAKRKELDRQIENTSQSNSKIAVKISGFPICSNHLEKISDKQVKSNSSESCESRRYSHIMATSTLQNKYEISDSNGATVVANEYENISVQDEVTHTENSRQSSVQQIGDSAEDVLENNKVDDILINRDCLFHYLSDRPAVIENVVSRVAEDLMKKLNRDSSLPHSMYYPFTNHYQNLSQIESLPTTVQMLPQGSSPTVKILPDGAICQTSTSNISILPTGNKKKDKCSNIYQIAHQIGPHQYLLLDHIIPSRLSANQAALNSENATSALSTFQQAIGCAPSPPSPPEYTVMAYTTHQRAERESDSDAYESRPNTRDTAMRTLSQDRQQTPPLPPRASERSSTSGRSSTSSHRPSSSQCQERSLASRDRGAATSKEPRKHSSKSCRRKSNSSSVCKCKSKDSESKQIGPQFEKEQRNDITVPPTVFAHHPQSMIGLFRVEIPQQETAPPMHVFDLMLSQSGQSNEGCGMRECPQGSCGPPCAKPPPPPPPSRQPLGSFRSGLPMDTGPVESTRYPAADYRLHRRLRKGSAPKSSGPSRKRIVKEYIDEMGVKRQRVLCGRPEPCGQPIYKKTSRGLPPMFRSRPHSKIGEMPYQPLISTLRRRYCRNCSLEICPGEEIIVKRLPRSGVEFLERELGSTMLDQEIEFRRPRCALDAYGNV